MRDLFSLAFRTACALSGVGAVTLVVWEFVDRKRKASEHAAYVARRDRFNFFIMTGREVEDDV